MCYGLLHIRIFLLYILLSTPYLKWFGTAKVKEQGHPATASYIWTIAFYAF
jgi:hypothetical protein